MADADNATMSRKAVFDAINGLSVKDLTALRDAAETKRQEKLQEAKDAVLQRARSELEDLGLSLDDLLAPALRAAAPGGKKGRKEGGSSVPVKYRGPNGEEWSGRGRLPKWVQVAEAEGKSRETFKV